MITTNLACAMQCYDVVCDAFLTHLLLKLGNIGKYQICWYLGCLSLKANINHQSCYCLCWINRSRCLPRGNNSTTCAFLHDRPWIPPWIKSISNELDISIHLIASQFSGHCDVINNRLWRHQQNENRASETPGWCVKIIMLSSFTGNKHRNDTFVSIETVRHESTCIILYILRDMVQVNVYNASKCSMTRATGSLTGSHLKK